MSVLTRREFLRLCTTAALVAGGSKLFYTRIAEAVEKAEQPIIWVRGAGCTGCSSSMFNSVDPGIRELFADVLNLKYHPGLMDYSSFTSLDKQLALARQNEGKYILVIEGAIPTVNNGDSFFVGDQKGQPINLLDYINKLNDKAKKVVALGSCTAFGGLLAAKPNPLEVVRADKLFGRGKVINLPGCPPHPDWVVGTLAHLALFGMPEVDDFGRPRVFYRNLIHNNCPRRQHFDNSIFARKFGEDGCLLELGCKGPLSHGDCSTRLWNNGNSWCVHSGVPCIGCTDPSFPDLTMPFYKRMPIVDLPGINSTADTIGLTVGVATGVGLAAHFVGNLLAGRIMKKKSKDGGGGHDQ